jgi:DNA-binding winged helix-turn-helix (wHTH) protein/Tol biopolymer transport system component
MISEDRHLYEFGDFRVDPDHRLLLRENKPVPLQPKAFDILLALIRNHESVVLKDDLLKMVWPETFVEEANLAQNISVLRKALGEARGENRYIVTVPGKGYRFAEQVRALSLAAQHSSEREDVSVQHSLRTRILIENGSVDRKGLESILGANGALQLPPGPSREVSWRKRWIAALTILLSALAGALVVWIMFRPAPLPKVLRSVAISNFGRAEPFGEVLTDGPRIFFAERMGGTWRLAQVAEQGGEESLIPVSVPGVVLHDIDRRSGRLLVTSRYQDVGNDSLWIVRTGGSSGQRVGDVLADSAAWSPDGQRIVYSRRQDLFVVGDDGLLPRKLLSAPGIIEFLRWSPDGQHIGLTVRSYATATRSLWEVSSDGHDLHLLSLGWKDPSVHWGEGECCGDWSPDGRYFIFHSARDGVQSLWIMRRRKSWFGQGWSNPVQLYTSPQWLNAPRFSADGKKILLVNFHERRELVRYDPAAKQFLPYLGGIPVRHLSFSRDGQWVAYSSERDHSLWRARTDGTQALQLTFPPLDASRSSWSPDGKKIVFEGNQRLYVVSSTGGNAELLMPETSRAGQPSWSADGNGILFTLWDAAKPPHLGLLNLGNRKVQMLPDSDDFEGPQWSPDGKYAVAADRRDRKLMLFDFDSRTWSELADGTPYGWGIRWSSDSKYVYYQHNWAEEQPIYRVRVSDRKVDQITSSQEIHRADVLSFSMTGLMPDNSPVASFVHTNADVQALELDLP